MALSTTLAGTFQPPISNSEYLQQNFGAVSSSGRSLQEKILGVSSPLGIYANTASTPTASDSQDFEPSRKMAFKQECRQKKSVFRAKVKRDFLAGRNEKMFDRLKKCGSVPVASQVSVLYNDVHQVAHYGGLFTCGSVWGCPVCSAKIQSRRAAELEQVINEAYARGHKVVMFTFTHPHQAGHALVDLIGRHSAAMRRFKGGRWWQDNFSKNIELGYDGNIMSYEVTTSIDNGWHWHSHMLLICDSPDVIDEQAMIERWVRSYKAVCRREGVAFDDKNESDMLRHGLDIMKNCHASDYLQKMGRGYWGADKELSSNGSKQAKLGDHYTPFDLIELNRGDLYLEYLEATWGKRQLIYSVGLKAKYGIIDKTDEELAIEERENSFVVAVVPNKDWRIVDENDWQCTILDILEVSGSEALEVWAKANGLSFSFVGCVPPPLSS